MIKPSTESKFNPIHTFIKRYPRLLILTVILAFTSCVKEEEKKIIPSWKEAWNVSFTEVRRTFASGVVFNDFGHQLKPEWRFKILSDTSVSIYSPKINRFVTAHIQFDHDSIYNFAWAWLRVRKLSKDSILFQVMKVKDTRVLRKQSNIYMTLYSDDYIKYKLKKNLADLVKPNRQDSIFIMDRIHLANTDTSKAFPAHEQAILNSKSSLLTINKTSDPDNLISEYDITIKRSYKPFNYSFSVVIDQEGKLLFRRSRVFIMPEFENRINSTIRGIVNGYLSAYLDTHPGKTLGAPHSTIVFMNVRGVK
ncbi:MAG: hypothetical protein ACO1N7_03750 [Sphingobacteriaceae bacterium]